MSYQDKIEKAIQYIGLHLNEKITLEKISDSSCLSKFHFHRLFTALTGLSLHQYIRWLRLKRAAHQLKIDKNQSIIHIAIQAGFESHEAFSRAFKKCCGMTPSQYRATDNGSFCSSPPYSLAAKEVNEMTVEIKNIKRMRLAAIEHRGDPNKMGDSINQLVNWAKAQSISLKPKAGEAFGFGYDDPKITAPEKFRFDLGIKVPKNFKLDNQVIEKYLPEGRYAIATHLGSHSNIGETVYGLYRDWLPESGEELGELPCIFCYQNFEHEVAETQLKTECWLYLK
jgi:AraC family transcriptional regulator